MLKTCFVSLFVFIVFACSEKKASFTTPTQKRIEVEAMVIDTVPLSEYYLVLADVLPMQEVEIKAPLDGLLLGVFFNEGDQVREGDLLFQLDDRSYTIEKKALEAEKVLLERQLIRSKELLAADAGTVYEIEALEEQLILLNAKINSLEHTIELTQIKAPFSGQIGFMDIAKGAYIRQGDMLAQLVQNTSLKIDFNVPEVYVTNLKVGSEIRVITLEDTLTAKIYAINAVIDKFSRSLAYRAKLNEVSNLYTIKGAYAEVIFPIKQTNQAIVVPPKAVVYDIDQKTVYTLQNGRVKKQPVETGSITSESVEIVSGLKVGDTLIVSGLLKMKEGIEVELTLLNKD